MPASETLSLLAVSAFIDGHLDDVAGNVRKLLGWSTNHADVVTDIGDRDGNYSDGLCCHTVQLSSFPDACSRSPSLELMQLYDPIRKCARSLQTRTMGALTVGSTDVARTRARLVCDGMPVYDVSSTAKPGAFQVIHGGLIFEVVQDDRG